MRNKTLIILLLLITTKLASCQQHLDVAKIKDEDFKKYVSAFQTGSLPFSTFDEMFCRNKLELTLVKRFICNDESCLKDWSGYDIEFSPCKYLPSNGDYVMLMHDESTEGGTVRKLSTYNYNGEKIATLEIFAEKPFHGVRGKNEIDYFEVESIINDRLIIKKQYFETSPSWKENDKRFFYGRYIESVYKIDTNGNITLVSEKDHGRQKYVGGRLGSGIFPRWNICQ